MQIAVIGLGKIGLPLAVQYAGKGHRVFGVDVRAPYVDQINAGITPYEGESELVDRLAKVVRSGALTATLDYRQALHHTDVVVVVVPVVVDAEARPDFSIMDGATRSLGAALDKGTLIIYETTLPVGTTRGRWLPMIEEASGLTHSRDFDLVFSPERVLTGRVFADLKKYPKLVGGLTPRGARQAKAFYEAVLDFDPRTDLARANGVWDLGSAEAAELAKLAETTYRDVNIGLANQFARYADQIGVDIYAVIEACNSQPYSHIHRPGIAVGGHCIPVYPRLYLSGDPSATIVSAAREANAGMPEYAVGLLGDLAGTDVVVLGAAYRGGVAETAFSGVFGTVDALRERGAHVMVHDPMFTDEGLRSYGFQPYHRGEAATVAIVQADHAEYKDWGPTDIPGIQVLLDGRNITDPAAWPGVRRVVIGA